MVAEDKLDDFLKRITDIETKLALLGSGSGEGSGTGNEGGNGGTDINVLNDLLKQYMKKSDMDSLLKRLEKCEKDSKEAGENS